MSVARCSLAATNFVDVSILTSYSLDLVAPGLLFVFVAVWLLFLFIATGPIRSRIDILLIRNCVANIRIRSPPATGSCRRCRPATVHP